MQLILILLINIMNKFIEKAREKGIKTEHGIFGADMKVA